MTINKGYIAQMLEFPKVVMGNRQIKTIALKEHDGAFGRLNLPQAFLISLKFIEWYRA